MKLQKVSRQHPGLRGLGSNRFSVEFIYNLEKASHNPEISGVVYGHSRVMTTELSKAFIVLDNKSNHCYHSHWQGISLGLKDNLISMVNATKSQNTAGLPESTHNQEPKEFQAVNNQTVNNFLEDWEKSLRPIQV